METFKEFIVESQINEANVGRIWQYVQGDESFGVLSAQRSDKSKKENADLHKQLKKLVRDLGYGFVELRGGFVETLDDNTSVVIEEDSLFIPKISKKDIIDLGVKFDQDAVLFKDNKEFNSIGTSTRTGVGKLLDGFKLKAGKENLTFAKHLISSFYSKLKKGKSNKFLFQLKEKIDFRTFARHGEDYVTLYECEF